MSLAIVRSNRLLLRGPHEKGAQIRQQPKLMDGLVITLLAPWRGWILGDRMGRTGRDDGRKVVEGR